VLGEVGNMFKRLEALGQIVKPRERGAPISVVALKARISLPWLSIQHRTPHIEKLFARPLRRPRE
jgi:hypothetical protein